MVDNDTMNHQEWMDELVLLCKERESGTVFLNIPTGESARLVLNKGTIHWIAYEQQRGVQAIELIRGIDLARLSFNPSLKLAIGEQQLPSTSDILKQLYKQNDKPILEHDVRAETPTNLSPGVQADLSGEKLFDQDQVRLVLEKESMEYLGPMAKIICSDHLKSMPAQLSLVQIHGLMAALKKDINDEKKGQAFMIQVRKGLNIQ